MSWLPCLEPDVHERGKAGPVDIVIEPVSKDLGGFSVRRALPNIKRRTVGPFIFLDHMGPAILPPGQGIDVRPHPHIGLATLTYLTEGTLFHRDTLGTAQEILPGAVNLMVAGRGIVHSERSSDAARGREERSQGIQSWLGLPRNVEESDPGFIHMPVANLPFIEDAGVSLRLIMGSLFNETSPVPTLSVTVYADAAMDAASAMPFPADYAERAAYVVSGEVQIGGDVFGEQRLLVFRPGDEVTVRAVAPSRVLLLGGEPLDGERHLWWNFVSSSRDRIEAAKADWKAGRFGVVPGDEAEFIPLPAI